MAGKSDEIRRDGAKAIKQEFTPVVSRPGSRGQDGPGVDGGVEGKGHSISPDMYGYAGMPEELERNDDTRHPDSKIWVRRDRKPNAYLHTGNG